MKKILLFLLTISFATSFAQHIDITSQVRTLNMSKRLDGPPNVEGSPYISDAFTSARIALTPNKIYNIRYNAFSDELEVEGENDSNYVLDKNMDNLVVEMLQGTDVYKSFEFITDNGNKQRGFFILLNDLNAEIKLLKQQKIVLITRKEPKSSYQPAVPAHFKKLDDIYYIKIKEQPAVPFSKNKKDVVALFLSHKSEVLQFIKDNKLNLKKEPDLIQLTDYLNNIKPN